MLQVIRADEDNKVAFVDCPGPPDCFGYIRNSAGFLELAEYIINICLDRISRWNNKKVAFDWSIYSNDQSFYLRFHKFQKDLLRKTAAGHRCYRLCIYLMTTPV